MGQNQTTMGESLTTTMGESLTTARQSLNTASNYFGEIRQSLSEVGQQYNPLNKKHEFSCHGQTFDVMTKGNLNPTDIIESNKFNIDEEEDPEEQLERIAREKAEQKRLATDSTRNFLKHAIRGIDILLLDEKVYGGKIDAILTIDSQLTTISIAQGEKMSYYPLCDIESIQEGAEAGRMLNSVLPDVAFYVRDSERERVVRLDYKRDSESETMWFIYSSGINDGAVKTALEILQMCAVVIPKKDAEGEAEVSESTAEPKS